MLAGVGHVASIVVRVGETERVRAVDIGFYRLRAVKQVDGRKSGCTRRAGGVRCLNRLIYGFVADKSLVVGLSAEQLVPPALVVGTALVLRDLTCGPVSAVIAACWEMVDGAEVEWLR